MDEKTMNASKKNILLRSFFMRSVCVVLTVAVVVLGISPVSATSVHDPCSVHIDVAHYVSNVVVDGDVKTVYYDLPLDNQGFATKISNGIYYAEPFGIVKDARFDTWGISGTNKFPTYPLGRNTTFSVEDLRSGAELVFDGCFSMKGWEMNDPISPVSVTVGGIWFYYDENCKSLGYGAFKQTTVNLTYLDTEYEFSWTAEIPSGVAYVYPRIDIQFDVDAVDTLSFNCTSFAFHHDVNMLLDNSQTMQRIEKGIEDIGGKLDDLGDGVYEVKDKLDDIEQGIVGPGGTNDKLDDIGGSLETLPGEIGDEIQGVIDQEKQEAEEGGNKFVDQLLDLLPDPSTGVLASLQGLTNATSYTGTEAVLVLPSLTIPAVGGLIPETVLWEGGEMNFGEYFEMLPPSLLTLVRSLFTIAIVLYCAYELKGIISFVFTLKGGGK